jgi:hypothetical protein
MAHAPRIHPTRAGIVPACWVDGVVVVVVVGGCFGTAAIGG